MFILAQALPITFSIFLLKVSKLNQSQLHNSTTFVIFTKFKGTTNGVPSRTCNAYDSLIANGYGTVVGIGLDKATAIWYRAQSLYFLPSMTFHLAYLATVRAAAELFGFSSKEVAAVNEAWYAVNV